MDITLGKLLQTTVDIIQLIAYQQDSVSIKLQQYMNTELIGLQLGCMIYNQCQLTATAQINENV